MSYVFQQLVNKVSGSNLTVGYGLESCTTEVQVTQPFEYRGKKVILVDTPGFDDTEKSDTEILRVIASFLCQMSATDLFSFCRVNLIYAFQVQTGHEIIWDNILASHHRYQIWRKFDSKFQNVPQDVWR
jgi:GTPase Era involved in 16S rRNA processing